MRRALASAPAVEPPASQLTAYAAYLARAGHGNSAYEQAARSFVRRWPDPQAWAARPLSAKLQTNSSTRPFIMFLMVTGRLRPGYDYLVARKLTGFRRYLNDSPLQPDLSRFDTAATELGFTEKVTTRTASQAVARLLIQTGARLDELTDTDLDDLTAACQARQERTGAGWRHYHGAIHATRQVLFHLGVLDTPALPTSKQVPLEQRMAEVAEPLRGAFVAYRHRRKATCKTKTVSSLATRLAGFGRFLAEIDPDLTSLAELDRRRHIEPFLTSLTGATNSVTGEPITVADQARRVHAVANFLAEITEWGWDDAPPRRLVFRSDLPRLPRPLPRYLPVDADRRLTQELADSPPTHRPARPIPVHPSRPPTVAKRAARRTEPRRHRRRHRTRLPAPTAPYLRHRAGQRRLLAAGADGPARARLSADEPALCPAVRPHRAHRIRTRARPDQKPPRTTTRRPARLDHRTGWHRLARQSHHQGPAGRRLLPARPSSRRLPLRQHLRTLPQLPNRRQPPRRPRRPARRRPSRRRQNRPRQNHALSQPAPACRHRRPPHPPNRSAHPIQPHQRDRPPTHGARSRCRYRPTPRRTTPHTPTTPHQLRLTPANLTHTSQRKLAG